MLRQEINLYRQFLTPVTDASYLTWKRYWIFNGIVTILLIFVYISSSISDASDRRKLLSLQTNLTTYQAKFNQIKSKMPQLFFSENINESVKNLKKEMETQNKIISILSVHAPFSEDLYALSRTITPKVWLSTIIIEKNGSEIILKGNSIGIDNLNNFIENLSNEKKFDGYEIQLQEAKNQDISNPNVRINFEVNMAKKHE